MIGPTASRDGATEDEFDAAAARDLGAEGDQYEHAMPFWQSYAGLKRYWDKREEAEAASR